MVLKRTFAAILAIFAVSGAAGAAEMQGKVLSVTDLDGMAYCDKCDPDAVPSQTRVENYRRTIVDTVAMGANAILVQTRPGVARQVRMAEFAQALAAYNASAAPADRACMAVMYADYGTPFSDSDLSGFFASAWSADGYCLLVGKPIVATLDDRSDQTCLASKHANMIARLRGLASGTAPTSLNWAAAFGDRGEYQAWSTDCKDKITPSGFPLTYSYLEMANSDPAFATDAATRKAAVKAGGGAYILGLPAASAQNCGDFCGDAFDKAAPTHTDFSGFGRLLAAWRAGADYVAYTYGPGGPAWLDQAAGSATRCGPNDLVTPAADCLSVAAADRALIPGAPAAATGGGDIPPHPVTSAQCTGVTPPPGAAEKGMTKLAFCEDFSSPARINLTGALNSGQTFTQTSPGNIFNSPTPMPASAFTFNSDGTMTVVPTQNYSQINIITSKPTAGGNFTGYAMPGGNWYVEMRWNHDNCNGPSAASGGFPAFWTMDARHLYGTVGGYYEPDFYEYIGRSRINALHWYPSGASNSNRVSKQISGSISNVTSFFTVAARASNNGGAYDWYLNNTRVGGVTPHMPADFMLGKFPIMIGGGKPNGVPCKYTVDWVRAWEKP